MRYSRIFMVLFFTSYAMATNYYVSSSIGSDSYNGTSSTRGTGTIGPFVTIQKAADLTNPGDTTFIMNGTYTNAYSYVLEIKRSGSVDNWIVFRAYPGHSPRLSHNGWCGIKSTNTSYIEINGLEIVGNRENITLAYANANGGIAATSGGGIEFDGRGQQNRPHHIRILNNTISKCCGGGISMIQCDYITIDNNRVWGNAWFSQWANSGISTYQNFNFDNTTGYKMIITRNICYDNRSLVNWVATGALSDGNGIIIDDLMNTQNGSTLGSYKGRTLVSNNLCFNNGGSGLHTLTSEHVDFINNTAYKNAAMVDYPNVGAVNCNDIKMLNNICYARSGRTANWTGNTNSTFDYNIYYGGKTPTVTGTHDQTVDPRFVLADTNSATADFHLQNSSPAVEGGTATGAPATDLDGVARPQGVKIDIGAYEYLSSTNVVKYSSILTDRSGLTARGSRALVDSKGRAQQKNSHVSGLLIDPVRADKKVNIR